MLYVLILYISGGTDNLKTTSYDRFFKKLFMAILFTLRVLARNLLRANRRRNTFCILLWCLAWGANPGFTSDKMSHYLLDYGNFIIHLPAFFWYRQQLLFRFFFYLLNRSKTLSFQCHTHTPISDVHATLFLLKSQQFWNNLSCRLFHA